MRKEGRQAGLCWWKFNNSGTGSVITKKYTKPRTVVFANVHGVTIRIMANFMPPLRD